MKNGSATSNQHAGLEAKDLAVKRNWGAGNFETINNAVDAFEIVAQLRSTVRHRLWHQQQLIHDGYQHEGSLLILDQKGEWRHHYFEAFDCIALTISQRKILEFAEETGRPEFSGFKTVVGANDQVVHSLIKALLPSVENPEGACLLYVEQVCLALMVHLAQHYGGLYFPSARKGTLAQWQERTATEFLAAHLNGRFTLDELADACNLSKSYLMRAFKESFGTTPYQWLIGYRLGKAKELLLSPMPIAEVAQECGFADQSHLTRAFSEALGMTPGEWRRARGGYSNSTAKTLPP